LSIKGKYQEDVSDRIPAFNSPTVISVVIASHISMVKESHISVAENDVGKYIMPRGWEVL
jgi:hypothetical protein